MSWTMTKRPSSLGGVQKYYKFSNGLRLSVVKHLLSYGHDKDLWEVAVLDSKSNWKTKEVFPDATDDVIGWLEPDEVVDIISKVDKFLG